jgi:glutathione peroxidase
MDNVFEFSAKDIKGKDVPLSEYKGKVLLVVNVASKCGYTPQYKGLQELYQKYHEQGFEVLAFPCNQFGAQEPGTSEAIANFCDISYKTTFPLFEKIEVNGTSTHPLYKFLKQEQKGILGTGIIKWNFTKFLVNREGQVVERFGPQKEPADIDGEIKKLL